MFSLTLMLMLILTFTLMLALLSTLISKKMFIDREKSSPFECGFNPKSSSRLPFSLQFFIITLLFLIFDVEMTLIIPLIISTKLINLKTLIFLMIMFILILIFGILHELIQGVLDWSN
uniref:NADH-ubiquinone oxidoreductase chain 3 n=1 Tax=Phrixothrix hirtus TaxID=94779 RepID=A0A0R6B8L8_PHRHR|nr:NADH dehydrogenase subunit 3 [Phrixothrix hirtus]